MRAKKEKVLIIPRPVHPRATRHHGLFGRTFVRQHMVIEENWTPDSLTQEFRKMGQLLTKHAQFNRLLNNVEQKEMVKTYFNLQRQCRDGRALLKRLRAGSLQEVKKIFNDHRDMQRLYQKMPLSLVEENINQRTFVMRRERDRLESRLQKLKQDYNDRLLAKANIENFISYENEFKLEEEMRIKELLKKLENSRTRLKAVQAINATYKKILQILRHDETFYAPIIRSLDKDIEDQSKFIKHILFVGAPAISHFKEIGEEYKFIDDKVRKSSRKRSKECFKYRDIFFKPAYKTVKGDDVAVDFTRYVRESTHMLELKSKFEEVEEIIKKVKIATVCSSEKNIFGRIKSHVNSNLMLGSEIENHMLGHSVLENKGKCATVLKGVLHNNLSDVENARLGKIKTLKKDIKFEDEYEEEVLNYNKNLAKVYVLVRFSLWNLYQIVKHVGIRRMTRVVYPVEHLQLPLLKFEMLSMKAYPPEPFEENLSLLLSDVKSKVRRLVQAFDFDLSGKSVRTLTNLYGNQYLNSVEMDLLSGTDTHYLIDLEPEIDLIEEVRSYKRIATRKQIKLASARLVEESIKKDD